MSNSAEQPNGKPPSTLSEQQLLFIDGAYTPASDGGTFAVTNPMTGAQLYESASATVEDYTRAIEAAAAALPAWRRMGPSARRLIFFRAADIIERYMNEDAPELLSAEVSAPKGWVKVNIHATAGVFREAASLATHIKGEIVPADRPGTTLLVEREPLGVVLAISPWNAPVNLSARAIAVPLMCGNTVILKPSEFSPKSQHLVVRALTEAGLPAGVLNFLPTSAASTPAVTEHAVRHPTVRHVNFTGSDRVGRIIAGWAAEGLKKCVLELGGKAPVVVLEDAELDDAVEAVVFGAMAYSGQVCMSTERVLVHELVAGTFQEKLVERVKQLKVGNHEEDSSAFISGLFTPQSALRVQSLLQGAVSSGAQLVLGDLAISGPNQTILSPHILSSVTPDMPIFQHESFGPLICLTTFSTEAEAIELANATKYSLCAAVWSRDVMRALDVARQVRAGACHVNGPTLYVESTLPQGGVGGASGYGRFGGIAGVEEFTERKIITLAKPGMRFPM